jgi:hypothetical protein
MDAPRFETVAVVSTTWSTACRAFMQIARGKDPGARSQPKILHRIRKKPSGAPTDMRERPQTYYSEIVRPSVDPELMIRTLCPS